MIADPDAGDVRDGRRWIPWLLLTYALLAGLWLLIEGRLASWLIGFSPRLAPVAALEGWLFAVLALAPLYPLARGFWSATGEGRTPTRGGALALAPGWSILLLLAVIALLTASGILLGYQQQRDHVAARLLTIAELKRSQISDWLDERLGDAGFLRASLSDLDPGANGGAEMELDAALIRALESFAHYNAFQGVVLLDAGARPLWGSEGMEGPLDAGLVAAVKQAIHDQQIGYQGPYRDASGSLHMDFLVPLSGQGEGRPGLLILLHSDPAFFLHPRLGGWPIPTASGETLLQRLEGERILVLNPPRHLDESRATGGFELPVANADSPMTRFMRDPSLLGKLLEGRDYRGEPTLGVAVPVPATDWRLLVKIDLVEVIAEAARGTLWIALAGWLALLATLAVAVAIRQRQRLALAESLRHSQTERLNALSLLDAIVDGSTDAIYAKDLEGRYLLFSRAACEFVGRERSRVLGRDDAALFPPEVVASIRARDRQIMASETRVDFKESLVTALGERTFLTTKGPLRDALGGMIGVFGVSRDITEIDRVTRALADETARRLALIERSRDGILVIDQEHRITEANRRFAEMLGYPPEELIGLRTWEYDTNLTEADVRAGFANLETLQATFESRHRRKDGSEYEVEVSVSGTNWGGERMVLCICRDISERKRAERLLRETNGLLGEMSAIAHIGAWEFDVATGQGTWTEEAARIHGLDPNQATDLAFGLNFSALTIVPGSRARSDPPSGTAVPTTWRPCSSRPRARKNGCV